MRSLPFDKLCSVFAQWAGRGFSDNRSSSRASVLAVPSSGNVGAAPWPAAPSPPHLLRHHLLIEALPHPTPTPLHPLSIQFPFVFFKACTSSRHFLLFMNVFLIDYPLPLWERKLHDNWTCLSGSPVSPGLRLGPGTWLVFVGCFLNE